MNKNRRSTLKALLAALFSASPLAVPSSVTAAQLQPQATARPYTHRLALLVGNGDYPQPHDLPPIHKNVFDLAQALTHRGFEVTQAMDLDEQSLHLAVQEFVRKVAAAPPDAVTLFYYAGHGLQVQSNNLLLGAGANPAAPGHDLIARSLVLQQRLLAALPPRQDALNITVIDACRTDIQKALGDMDGLNQVEAPLGSLVCFSTGAGRPAVSPSDPNQRTFYTDALIENLGSLPDHTTFSELFQFVKMDVEATMGSHPLQAIRRLIQRPFIADNTRVPVPLGMDEPTESLTKQMPAEELKAWTALQADYWPVSLAKQSKQFLQRFPDSVVGPQVKLTQQGAQTALEVLRRNEVRLFKTSFTLPDRLKADRDAWQDLCRAGRGDKDAAARIARMHRADGGELGHLRFEGWMQYASALGNGIASYELALHYRGTGQPVLAAQAESTALNLGYLPPRSLGHERK